MFWIGKRKTNLSEVFKDGFVDIHNHLLPEIDDGAKSVTNTQEMILGMQELGITEAIATPHTYPGLWNSTQSTILDAYQKVEQSFITGVSSEYLADASLLQLNEDQMLLPLKNKHLLIEFAMLDAPWNGLFDVLFALKHKGYNFILAHPERYLYWEKKTKMFDKLKDFDMHFQLNALSLLGYYGESTKKLAEFLLSHHFYDFLGTDFHHLHHIDYAKKEKFDQKYELKVMELAQANSVFSHK